MYSGANICMWGISSSSILVNAENDNTIAKDNRYGLCVINVSWEKYQFFLVEA